MSELTQPQTKVAEGATVPQKIIAVTDTERNKWGCPYCGYRSGNMSISGNGCGYWRCGECGKSCCLLAEGVTRATISTAGVYPELQEHPRKGTPARGRPDTRPEGGGEFFGSRGIGLDVINKCFVCGTGLKDLYSPNIAAFVQHKDAGDRIVAMFGGRARLDYRENYPDRIQLKVGTCKLHKPHLEALDNLVADGVLTADKIKEAIG